METARRVQEVAPDDPRLLFYHAGTKHGVTGLRRLTVNHRTGYGFLMAEPTPSRRDLAADAWAEVCDLLDLQLSPLGMRAIGILAPIPGEVLMDVGCGAGQSVLQLAERVGPDGRVIGVDVARRLLDLARRRADGLRQVSFLQADAQTLRLTNHCVDGVFSRFGVMAFGDQGAAFSNFRRTLKPSGRLAFACWRSLEENELDVLPLRAAGLESMVDPTPFSLADPEVIHATLEAAGFEDVTVEAYDQRVSSGGLEEMAQVLLRVGPLGRILRENPDLRTRAEPRLRAALTDREVDGAVVLRAATWIVSARAGVPRSA